MIHPSDTPPNGDFAAYVERLTGANAVPAAKQDLFRPKSGPAGGSSFSASAGLPSASADAAPVAPASFATHVKWAVGLWLAAQLLARYVPGAGNLFIPALGVYAAWVIFKLMRRAPAGGLFNKLGALARQAAEEAKKAQTIKPKIKP